MKLKAITFVVMLLIASVTQAAERVRLYLAVDPSTHTFAVWGRVWDLTPDPTWTPQDPGDVVHGLAGYIFDLRTTGTVQLSGIQLTGPKSESPPKGFLLTQTYQRNSNAWLAGALQYTFFGPSYVIPAVGVFQWVELVRGQYTGSGSLSVIVLSSVYNKASVSVLYDSPLGWDDPAKVEAPLISEINNVSVTIP